MLVTTHCGQSQLRIQPSSRMRIAAASAWDFDQAAGCESPLLAPGTLAVYSKQSWYLPDWLQAVVHATDSWTCNAAAAHCNAWQSLQQDFNRHCARGPRFKFSAFSSSITGLECMAHGECQGRQVFWTRQRGDTSSICT